MKTAWTIKHCDDTMREASEEQKQLRGFKLMRYITSQLERIESIVHEKQEAKDYEVSIVVLTVDGEEIALVIDGHHSHEAAKRDGVEPAYKDVTDDYAREINHLGGNGFCDAHNCGEGWWEINTGKAAW